VIFTFASPDKWETVRLGAEIFMYEGPHLCGTGSVQWKEKVSPSLSDRQKARYRRWVDEGS